MSTMSRQFVLELEFKVKNRNPLQPEKQLVIVDEGSISELSKLREDLGNFTSEPFIIQYLDEENDLVSIDTEEEFKEFTKLVKQRSSKGEVQKIVLNCNSVSVSERKPPSNAKAEKTESKPMELRQVITDPQDIEKAKQRWTAFALRECYKKIYKGGVIKEWQIQYKNELKQEILSEMKEELGAVLQPNVSQKEFDEYDEDSDGNLVCRHEKKRMKLCHNHKKIEKKEKHAETKIGHRLEKLELKKKKLLEKASMLRAAYKYSVTYKLGPKSGLPFIMSGIASADSVFLSKKVAIGKVFLHQWRIINDGTITWKDVELQHTWSTPGLEPDEMSIKFATLFPGQECQVSMKFRAPKTVGPFVSYWHFVFGPQWTRFGHYVSLNGNTKLCKFASATGGQIKEQDDHNMTEKKTVSFNQEAEGGPMNYKPIPDGSSYSEDQITIKKHLKASLASAEIAAEMAREAANAALRVASGMQTDTHEIISEMDQVIKNCQELRLDDSESDTDINIDVNEETDPGFVIVNMPSYFPTDENNPKDKNIQTIKTDSVGEVKETNLIKNQKNDEILTLPKNTADTKKEQDDIRTNTVMDKGTVVPKEGIEVAQEVSEPIQFERACYNLNNEGPNIQKTFSKLPDDQQLLHLGYPRMDPNVSYPVIGPPPRVTMAMYPPQQHPPHAYPMFAPQNSSSHGIVFPPPPMNYIPTPKINPPPYPPLPIPIPFPAVMTSPAEIPLQHLPLQPSAFQPPMARECKYSQDDPLMVDLLRREELFTDNTYQQATGSEVLSVSKPEIPATSSTLHTITNQNVEKKPENMNQQVLSKNSTTEMVHSTTNCATESRHVPTHEDRQGDATVQILPQGLVDGAINVASTAYSHAWNALNNLRPKECEKQEFDPVFQNNMAVLVEMGFTNLERNSRLLKRFKNDVNQVIGVICASPGGDNLEID